MGGKKGTYWKVQLYLPALKLRAQDRSGCTPAGTVWAKVADRETAEGRGSEIAFLNMSRGVTSTRATVPAEQSVGEKQEPKTSLSFFLLNFFKKEKKPRIKARGFLAKSNLFDAETEPATTEILNGMPLRALPLTVTVTSKTPVLWRVRDAL